MNSREIRESFEFPYRKFAEAEFMRAPGGYLERVEYWYYKKIVNIPPVSKYRYPDDHGVLGLLRQLPPEDRVTMIGGPFTFEICGRNEDDAFLYDFRIFDGDGNLLIDIATDDPLSFAKEAKDDIVTFVKDIETA